jgi:hypothetical protein
MTTLRQALTNSNPNSLGPNFQTLDAGQAMLAIARTYRGAVTSNKIVLPEDGKAARILHCYGMGTTSGFKTPLAVGSNTAPATTECSVNGQGDITFAAADAITTAYVVYVPYQGYQVYEDTVDVASNLGTLLGSRRAAVLLGATSLAGTLTGVFTPVNRGAAPTTGLANISVADDGKIQFAAADAVTRATVRYLAVPGYGGGVKPNLTDALASEVQMT